MQDIQQIARDGLTAATTLATYVQEAERKIAAQAAEIERLRTESGNRLKDLVDGVVTENARAAGAVGDSPMLAAIEAAVVARAPKQQDRENYLRARGWRLNIGGIMWNPPTGSPLPAVAFGITAALNNQVNADLAPFKDVVEGLALKARAAITPKPVAQAG